MAEPHSGSKPPPRPPPSDGAADLRFERGLEVRRAVLGDAHVDRSLREATDFDREFQEYITRSAWGEIWTRPGLPRATRHLLTIAMLAVLNRQEELAMHLEATGNTGVTEDEVKEVLMQVAVYAGAPAALAAIKTAKRVFTRAEGAQLPDDRVKHGGRKE
jgi:4-carboxymuconolactone decarboxylase